MLKVLDQSICEDFFWLSQVFVQFSSLQCASVFAFWHVLIMSERGFSSMMLFQVGIAFRLIVSRLFEIVWCGDNVSIPCFAS